MECTKPFTASQVTEFISDLFELECSKHVQVEIKPCKNSEKASLFIIDVKELISGEALFTESIDGGLLARSGWGKFFEFGPPLPG